jgi:hypothetical protein
MPPPDAADPQWQKPPYLKQRQNERGEDDEQQPRHRPLPDPGTRLTPLHACDSDEDYQQETTSELQRILASWANLIQISSMITDMHAWGILVLRELGTVRFESDSLIRRLAVDLVQSGHMQQQEVARLTRFSRNTISTWVRAAAESNQRGPEPPDDMTDPAQIDH